MLTEPDTGEHHERGFLRICRSRRAIDDVQYRRIRAGEVAANKSGTPLPGNHSPLFAPVPKPTIQTGVTRSWRGT
jgi:hypothetical protein